MLNNVLQNVLQPSVQRQLFGGVYQPTIPDPSARKHGGDAESEAAHGAGNKARDRELAYAFVPLLRAINVRAATALVERQQAEEVTTP